MNNKKSIDQLTYIVLGAAIQVHKVLGPGLLESVYHKCFKQELIKRSISFISEIPVPIIYNECMLETELRCDLLIEKVLVVELKAVEKTLPVHEAQVLTYMKLLNVPKGLLVNFTCVNIFKEGQKTFVNDHYRQLPDS